MAKLSIRALRILLVLISCSPWLHAAAVHASPLLELVGDTGATGGLQARTVGGGSAAAYFNPALLTDAPAGATLGLLVLNQRISLLLDGRPGSEFAVPDGIENVRNAEGERLDLYPAPTNLLQYGRTASPNKQALVARPRQGAGSGHGTLTYFVAGLIAKLFDDRLALAFHGLIPNDEFTKMRAFFNDEREQYFSNSLHPEMYADRLLALSVAFGMGLKVTDWLSLGASATLALSTSVGAGAYVIDPGDLGNLLLDIDAPVRAGIAPHFGILFKPTGRLRVSANAHSPQRIELGASFSFQLPNLIRDDSSLNLVIDYMPWRFALGAAYDLVQDPSQTLTLAGTLLYARWSQYEDRHGEVPTPWYAWADTFSPTLGLRYRFQTFTTGIDLTYAPTPVPEQTGRTNYVDNDRIGGSLSAEYGFEVLNTDIKLGAQFQAHHLLARYQRKVPTPTSPDGDVIAPELVRDELPDDARLSGEPIEGAQGLQTNNPGWPGFESIGWLVAAGLYVTVEM